MGGGAIRITIKIKIVRGHPPLGGLDPLHPLQAYEHWVFLRSNPLHLPLQAATGATGLRDQDHGTTGLPDYGAST
jgi:hypothetical protein